MNIIERAKKLILSPKAEWAVIDGETHTVQGLFTEYVMILAAIPAVAAFIGYSLVGMSGFGISYRVPIGAGIAHMVLSYLLTVGSVYLLALVVDALAPTFGTQKNFPQALKLAAFAPTAAWVAGIFSIVPALAILGLLGSLYSLYLLFVGLPMLMKVPEDKVVPYFVVLIIVFIVVGFVIATIAGMAIPSPVRGF